MKEVGMLSSGTFLLASRRFGVTSLIGFRGIQTTYMSQAKVAVVLSGCGVYDGSEIHEASACLVHLSRHKAAVSMFAPNSNQMHVVDHLKGAPAVGETRNVLVESARIARGKIQPLSELNVNNFDAVVFPGGFGAAKNLSSFAVDGAKMKVNEEVGGVIKAFHSAKKPIGLCCISPVLAARVIAGCEVTIGSDPDTAAAIREMGGKHVERQVNEVQVDATNKVITTPAFMCDAPLHEIFDGIGVMIANTLKQADTK